MKKKVRFTLAGMVFLIILATFVLLYSASPYLLVIEEVKTGDILWQAEAEEGDWFHHEYIHSVEKSTVKEKFMIGIDGQLLAMESWTKSFGAGMPFEFEGEMEQVDGFYVVSELNDPLDSLNILPSHLYLHTFHFAEEQLVLSEEPFKRRHLLIELRPHSWRDRIFSIFQNNN